MNRKQAPKLTLFVGGLIEKYNENKEFFVSGSLKCVSGKKEYTGNIISENGRLVLNFMNSQTAGKDILKFLEESVVLYDEIIFSYTERQGTTVITAS